MKSTMAGFVLVMGIGSVVPGSALAGDLEPPGSPAPTMVTLQEIYDLIQSQDGAGGGAVAKSGQMACSNEAGTPIACGGTGQDGEYQYGISVAPRFTDGGDGTVRDNLTGLIWLQNANCFSGRSWTNALVDANTLVDGVCGLADGSAAGDWRLPNAKELQSVTGYGNLPLPFGIQSTFHWSSTTNVDFPDNAWCLRPVDGRVSYCTKADLRFFWPVRSGD